MNPIHTAIHSFTKTHLNWVLPPPLLCLPSGGFPSGFLLLALYAFFHLPSTCLTHPVPGHPYSTFFPYDRLNLTPKNTRKKLFTPRSSSLWRQGKDGGSNVLRNAGNLTHHCMLSQPRKPRLDRGIWHFEKFVSYHITKRRHKRKGHDCEGGSKDLRNFVILPQHYIASQPRWPRLEFLPQRKPHISRQGKLYCHPPPPPVSEWGSMWQYELKQCILITAKTL
jgi:hypothetical protein